MATSGSANFTVDGDDIVKLAYQENGIIREGGSPSTTQKTEALLKLNTIIKQWMANSDYAPGFKAWCIKRATLFLQKNQASYSLGASGDKAAYTYVETTLTGDEATSSTSLQVASITGISDTDVLGVVLDDGTIHWTTVSGAPSGDTVTAATGLASAASSGNIVFAYTAGDIYRPLEILFVNRRNSDGEDTPIFEMDLDDYESIGDKDELGDPSRWYYENGRTAGTMFFDYAAEDVTDRIVITHLRPIEDMDAVTDDIDMPEHWFRPLYLELAIDLCGPKGIPIPVGLKMKRDEALALAQNVDPENCDAYFEPDAP